MTVRDRGSATVEFAILLPAVAVLVALILGVASWSVAAVRLQGAASAAARAAVTDGDQRARIVAREVAGAPVEVGIEREGEWIHVSLTGEGPWGLPLEATAVAVGDGG